MIKGPTICKYWCPVTGKEWISDEIALPKCLPANHDDWSNEKQYTMMGPKVCPEIQEKMDDHYVVLIGVDPEKSEIKGDSVHPKDNVYRTGEIVYLKDNAYKDIFDIPVPEGGIAYVETECIAMLKSMVEGQS